MTKDEAKNELRCVSYGTWAALTRLSTYEQIDGYYQMMVLKIAELDVSACKNWIDIYKLIHNPFGENI